ncbi:MAG: NADH:ubiquinone reductase (Na(+)-transporting) subunit C [Bacteroidales bacterium]|nr:NADH:ubiquinone reductase (Na(+)-transporting) subunit C [Bacteroidales bacterium]
MKKGDTNSNSYILIYASVIVVVVAFLLAFTNIVLRPRQNRNIELDTKRQILAALNITDVKDVEAVYNRYVKLDMLLQLDGTLVVNSGGFSSNYTTEFSKKRFHIFQCDVNGQTKYVFPLNGVGLWGPIWGYVALNDDRNTVYGAYFSHQSETPGLGAEIASPQFQSEFKRLKVMKDGKVGLSVVKYGKVVDKKYEVDGISGGTITSKGVDAMLKKCLSNYIVFFTNQ